MENDPINPPGFEHISTLSDSGRKLYNSIVHSSAGLTNPGPQSSLITEPQVLPSSSLDEVARVGMLDPSDGEMQTEERAIFDRLFSEEDEIVLLNGMIQFAENKKLSPLADLDAFRDLVKADLNVYPTNIQLKSKIRKFQKKYENNMRKQAKGKARKLKAHEKTTFELSKLVWENEYIKGNKGVIRQKASGKKNVDVDNVSLNRAEISRIGAEIFERGKGVEGEAEWFELKKAEMEIYRKKMELMHYMGSLVLDAMNSENR